MVINSVVIALVITIIVGIVLLLVINVVKFICNAIRYVRLFYRAMERIDRDPWNILEASWALGMSPTQVKILYTKFCEVRNSWRSLFRSTK